MIPVVISGGQGTRLWPISRAQFPKQFCQFLDESLQAMTYRRLLPLGQPWTVTTSDLKVLTERVLTDFKIDLGHVLYEPFGCNTAPALALVCHVFRQKNWGEEIVGVFPADHLILHQQEFLQAVNLASVIAQESRIVTLGVQPTYPATGYGYIEAGEPMGEELDGISSRTVIGFSEKPNREKAEAFVHSGNFYWNAGMFVFKVNTLIQCFERLAPELWKEISRVSPGLDNLADVYSRVEKISFDYAIMEKLGGEEQACIPVSLGWSDLGSWEEMAKALPDGGNVKDRVFTNLPQTTNFVFSAVPNKVYSLIDVNELLVVDTEDALLISKKGHSQEIKGILSQMDQKGLSQVKDHRFEKRPWGEFSILRDTNQFKSKHIEIMPGAQLSYQSHEKRAEHWIIVVGQGEVVLNDQVYPVKEGDHIFIPQGARHRMRNVGTANLEFIEVQVGAYFGEEDIVRYEDDYQRL